MLVALRLLVGLPPLPLPFPDGDEIALVRNPLLRSRVFKYRVIRGWSVGWYALVKLVTF